MHRQYTVSVQGICPRCKRPFTWTTTRMVFADYQPDHGAESIEHYCRRCGELLRWLFVNRETGEITTDIDYYYRRAIYSYSADGDRS